jgi:hypothetical protein
MLSSRAKIRHSAARLPHVQHHLQRQQRSAGALVLNARSYAATHEMTQQEESSDSIKHLLKGPVTPLTIFATSPPPEPHPSTYQVPAAAADGATLDFRLSFAFPTVRILNLPPSFRSATGSCPGADIIMLINCALERLNLLIKNLHEVSWFIHLLTPKRATWLVRL